MKMIINKAKMLLLQAHQQMVAVIHYANMQLVRLFGQNQIIILGGQHKFVPLMHIRVE